MPRKLRLEYPGAVYHVISRANGKGNLFETDVDRQDFVKTLAATCAKTGFQVHAYCLMRNHFHLVVETPQVNLVAGMRWFLSATLEQGTKSAPEKLALAARLRRETTLTLPWILARLHMGTWKSLNAKQHRWRKANKIP
jgi:REP element-mobilizing transposase RayT